MVSKACLLVAMLLVLTIVSDVALGRKAGKCTDIQLAACCETK